MRGLLWTVVQVLGLVLLALFGVSRLLPDLLGASASSAIRGAGFADAVFTVEHVGWEGLDARLRLGGDTGTTEAGQGVDAIRLEYSPAGLAAGRVDRVTLTGARLSLRVGPEGVELLGREAHGGPPATVPGWLSALRLPVAELAVDDAVLSLTSPLGAATVPLSGHLTSPGEGRLDGRLELSLLPIGPRATAELRARSGPSGLTVDLDARAGLAGALTLGGESYALDGDARLQARVRHDGKGLDGSAEVRVAGLSLRGPAFTVSGVNGLVALSSLDPVLTPPGQWLSANSIDVGLPLTEALVSFQVRRGERLAIEQAEVRWAGGRLRMLPASFASGDRRRSLTLEADGLDLEQVLAQFEVQGLEATGTLGGRIPVELEGSGVRVEGGRLQAAGTGRVRYDPADPPAFLGGGGDSGTAVLREALRNFHYDELALTIDGVLGKETVVGLKLKGANPDFQGGRPVALNVRLSGALDRILRSGLRSYQIPDSVRERIEQLGTPKTGNATPGKQKR